jgi:hypothetical protein
LTVISNGCWAFVLFSIEIPRFFPTRWPFTSIHATDRSSWTMPVTTTSSPATEPPGRGAVMSMAGGLRSAAAAGFGRGAGAAAAARGAGAAVLAAGAEVSTRGAGADTVVAGADAGAEGSPIRHTLTVPSKLTEAR